jgi:hypothetical protein
MDDGKVLWTATANRLDWLGGRPLAAAQRLQSAATHLHRHRGHLPGERWHATGDGTVVFNDNGKLTTYDASAIGLAALIHAATMF